MKLFQSPSLGLGGGVSSGCDSQSSRLAGRLAGFRVPVSRPWILGSPGCDQPESQGAVAELRTILAHDLEEVAEVDPLRARLDMFFADFESLSTSFPFCLILILGIYRLHCIDACFSACAYMSKLLVSSVLAHGCGRHCVRISARQRSRTM